MGGDYCRFACLKTNHTIGHPILPFKKVMGGIVYVLRTGCQWKMLPREYGSGSRCHSGFEEGVRLGIFKKMWIKLLKEYDGKKGIKWAWQSLDSISIKSPLWGRWPVLIPLTEANWAQKGILTDKAIPLSVVITSANTHDIKAVTDVIDNAVV